MLWTLPFYGYQLKVNCKNGKEAERKIREESKLSAEQFEMALCTKKDVVKYSDDVIRVIANYSVEMNLHKIYKDITGKDAFDEGSGHYTDGYTIFLENRIMSRP